MLLLPLPALAIASISSILAPTRAETSRVNVTVDDTLGNAQTGDSILYNPSRAWKRGPSCRVCGHPPELEKVHNETWHVISPDYEKENDQPADATFSFDGIAVYVYGLLAPQVIYDLSFFLDGELDDGRTFTSSPSTEEADDTWQYNVLLYARTDLVAGDHSITLAGSGVSANNVALLDYIVYTRFQDIQPPQPSSPISPILSSSVQVTASSVSSSSPSIGPRVSSSTESRSSSSVTSQMSHTSVSTTTSITRTVSPSLSPPSYQPTSTAATAATINKVTSSVPLQSSSANAVATFHAPSHTSIIIIASSAVAGLIVIVVAALFLYKKAHRGETATVVSPEDTETSDGDREWTPIDRKEGLLDEEDDFSVTRLSLPISDSQPQGLVGDAPPVMNGKNDETHHDRAREAISFATVSPLGAPVVQRPSLHRRELPRVPTDSPSQRTARLSRGTSLRKLPPIPRALPVHQESATPALFGVDALQAIMEVSHRGTGQPQIVPGPDSSAPVTEGDGQPPSYHDSLRRNPLDSEWSSANRSQKL